jgi:hypothetical protein
VAGAGFSAGTLVDDAGSAGGDLGGGVGTVVVVVVDVVDVEPVVVVTFGALDFTRRWWEPAASGVDPPHEAASNDRARPMHRNGPSFTDTVRS